MCRNGVLLGMMKGMMKTMNNRLRAATIAALTFTLLLTAGGARRAEAHHSKTAENAWKAGTYAAGAGSAYALSRGRWDWALVGGGATYLSHREWKKQVDRRHQHYQH